MWIVHESGQIIQNLLFVDIGGRVGLTSCIVAEMQMCTTDCVQQSCGTQQCDVPFNEPEHDIEILLTSPAALVDCVC